MLSCVLVGCSIVGFCSFGAWSGVASVVRWLTVNVELNTLWSQYRVHVPVGCCLLSVPPDRGVLWFS